MKIYTKQGDKGLTSLLGNKRVSKTDVQIEAYGSIDELNACIGLIRSSAISDRVKSIETIQNVLFRIGSLLASTEKAKADFNLPDVQVEDIKLLESEIDFMTGEMPELKSFVLPGSGPINAHCHLARTVCRRAERRVIELFQSDESQSNPQIVTFLNRLSDYLFTLARYATHTNQETEIKWLG